MSEPRELTDEEWIEEMKAFIHEQLGDARPVGKKLAAARKRQEAMHGLFLGPVTYPGHLPLGQTGPG